MATVAPINYLQLSSCDTTTAGGTWTINGIGADTQLYREGSGSIYGTLRTVGNNDMTFAPTTSKNLTNVHLRIWFLYTCLKQLNTDANGGIQIGVSDGVNTGYWYVSGSTTYLGGWYNLVVDTARACDSGTKPTMTAITSIIIRVNLTAAPKNATNTWIDNLNYCDGLQAYGTTFSLADILAAENATTGGWGVIRKISGIYYLAGSLSFGDTSGTTTCVYVDTSQVIVFENRPVASTLYGITVTGNSTNKTSFTMGAKSGTAGISGCMLRTESSSQTPKFFFTGSSSNVSTLKLYGCTFVDAGTITLPASAADKEVISCNFEMCAEVLPDTCSVTFCNFINCDDKGTRLSSTSHNLSDCSFVTCAKGIEFSAAGSFSLSNVRFTGCTKDLENNATATSVSSYSTQDATTSLNSTTGISAVGQSINGNGGQLAQVKFYMQKVGTPTGNMYAKLYASNGSSPFVPSGTALATSDAVVANSIGALLGLVEFQFTGTNVVTLSSGTNNYVVVVEYTAGTSTDYVKAAYHGTSPTHTGNYSEYISSWTGTTAKDLYFAAYSGAIVIVNCSGTSNPGTYANTGNGSTEIKNTVTLKVTCKNESGYAIEGINVRIEKSSDGTLVSNGSTNSSGIYSDATYKYLGDLAVNVIARKKGYKNTRASDSILSTGLSVPFTMIKDKAVDLP